MNRERKKEGFTDLFLAFCMMVFLISMAVVITLEFRPLYYKDIKSLKIEETSGYSEEEIRANYDALIDYNVSPFQDKLIFPDFPMSEEGEIHFREVKRIFQFFLKLFLISAAAVSVGAIGKTRKKEFRYLKWAGIMTLTVPAVLAIPVSMRWDQVFVWFHEIVFDNDYWLFDPVTDPVIRILPDEFFLHCALLIVFITAFGAIGCLILWKKKTNVCE